MLLCASGEKAHGIGLKNNIFSLMVGCKQKREKGLGKCLKQN